MGTKDNLSIEGGAKLNLKNKKINMRVDEKRQLLADYKYYIFGWILNETHTVVTESQKGSKYLYTVQMEFF